MAEANLVPPIPYKVSMLNPDGKLNDTWAKWFRQLFNRIGGTVALTNIELASLQITALAPINAQILALQAADVVLTTSATNQSTDIAALQVAINDLNQGPNL